MCSDIGNFVYMKPSKVPGPGACGAKIENPATIRKSVSQPSLTLMIKCLIR
jgi:hypothetical protein